jgi:hypothetical protein
VPAPRFVVEPVMLASKPGFDSRLPTTDVQTGAMSRSTPARSGGVPSVFWVVGAQPATKQDAAIPRQANARADAKKIVFPMLGRISKLARARTWAGTTESGAGSGGAAASDWPPGRLHHSGAICLAFATLWPRGEHS